MRIIYSLLLVLVLALLAGAPPAMAQDDEHSMPLESPSGWLPDLSVLSPSLDDKLPPAPATGPRAKPDPAKSGDQGLSLGELIELALANNPSTRSEWAQAKAAAAELGQAYSAYYPQASLTYTGSRVRSGEHFLGGGDEYETTWGPTLTISILLADLGGRGATVDEADQNLTAARYSFQQAVHDLLLSVHEGFFNYYAAIQGVSSARADLEAAQAGLDVAEAQHKVGVGTKSDVLQAQANLAQGQYQLEEALGTLRTTWVNLALVTGLPPEPRLKVADPAPADGKLAKLTSSQLTELAVKHRPELLALEAQVKAYRSAVRVADSAMWPTLAAGVELEQTEYSDQEGEYESTAYLELDFDLFTGFSSSYKRKEAVANLWDARGQLAATRLEITNNVLSQQQTYLSSQAQVTSSQAYLSSAEQSYQMALGLYREGLGTIVSVINAQDKLTEARSQLVQAQASLNIAAASLAHACGQAQRLGGK